MKSRHALLLVALMVALSTQGCGSGNTTGERDADCSARLRFANTTFMPKDATRQLPVRGGRLGRAGYLDCDGSAAPGLGKVAIFAVGGAGPTQAVIAAGRGGALLYVAKDLPRSQWPAVVRTAAQFMSCPGPMTFTGSWDFIATHSPGAGEYGDTLPYGAWFIAHSGDRIDPRAWARATIRATVTPDTDPTPSIGLARAAIRDHHPVRVSTTCTGDGHFRVAHLELSP